MRRALVLLLLPVGCTASAPGDGGDAPDLALGRDLAGDFAPTSWFPEASPNMELLRAVGGRSASDVTAVG